MMLFFFYENFISILCLTFLGEDSCSGDSGGPLVAAEQDSSTLNKKPKYLIGIVSFGTRKCGQGYPGVYTSIEYYLPWILDNMKP